MIKKYLIISLGLLCCVSCKDNMTLTRIEGERIEINDSIQINSEVEEYIKPYREHVNKNLDSVLCYAVDTYTKKDGELNTAIGNLMADAVLLESNKVFNTRTGKNIDMVLLNHGGIRSILSKGNVTTRTAFKMMPFENSIVVCEMKGTLVKDIITYLQAANRAHPISGMQLTLNSNYEVVDVTIQGEPIKDEKIYYVATNDYLYGGGDRMNFFKESTKVHYLDYKIRNILIDYFEAKDTLKPTKDNRFIKLN